MTSSQDRDGLPRGRRSRRRLGLIAAVGMVGLASLLLPTAGASARPANGSGPKVCATDRPLMAKSMVSPQALIAWYRSKNVTDARPSVTVDHLAHIFIAEGNAEGVAGDLAFVQAMIETGWLRHSDRVPGSFFNFSGIGAVDGGSTAAKFSSPTEGVRAQIQHLRAYADPTVTTARLNRGLVDPRFDLVLPKGRARNVSQLAGTWASDREYGNKIMKLHNELLQHAGVDCSVVK